LVQYNARDPSAGDAATFADIGYCTDPESETFPFENDPGALAGSTTPPVTFPFGSTTTHILDTAVTVCEPDELALPDPVVFPKLSFSAELPTLLAVARVDWLNIPAI
jgi:hypothetical protein